MCEEAKCPNIGECWGGGEDETATATIMVGNFLYFSSFAYSGFVNIDIATGRSVYQGLQILFS